MRTIIENTVEKDAPVAWWLAILPDSSCLWMTATGICSWGTGHLSASARRIATGVRLRRPYNYNCPHPLQAGFTLVEMLVVLVIIGLIMGLVGPRVLSYLSDSRAKAAQLQIESFSNSLDLFYVDTGRYPTTQEGLGALLQRPPGADRWSGPYLRSNSVPNDPWGNEYVYRSPGAHGAYDLMSYGSKGREGGENFESGIANWQH
jgi:general secretion pathway protein G